MAIDIDKFKDTLAFTGGWQGGRCKDIPGESGVFAAAICISLLRELKSAARYKPLKASDLQIVIDELIEKADMVEVEKRAGGCELQRKKH